ncbi:hypothetical protein QL285_071005 [Trifolium repens]|nr:hypothetical protein QL285_071005 [Trifolium repens]
MLLGLMEITCNRSVVQSSLGPVQPATPAQPATLVHPAAPAHPAAPVQPAALARPAAPTQHAAPSDLTPSAIHASTPEVFRFMPTPGLCLQTMVDPSQHVSREATIEEDVQHTSHDEEGEENEVDHEDEDEDDDEEVEVGQGNVPPIVYKRDDNGKIIIKPFGTA